MYLAWTWTIDQTQRFICGSYSQTIARKDAAFCLQIINSDKYRLYFPEIKLNKDAVDLFKNSKGGERYATSSGSGITGVHAHQILIDDYLNPQQATSKVERTTANDWVLQTLPTRKVDKAITPTIIVMQRLHEDDICGILLKKDGIRVKHYCLPAEIDTNVKPLGLAMQYVDGLLDPIRLSRPILTSMKSTLGSYGYAGQMQQKPAPSEGGVFKKDYFKIIEPHSVPKSKVLFCVDTAYTSNEKNDPTGMMAYSIIGNDLYIRSFKKGHWEFIEQCKAIKDFAAENGYNFQSMIYVEPKASGKSVVQTLKQQTDLNIKEAKNPTKDKEARANDISPYVESGRVYLVRGGWNDDFINVCATFPNGKHDEEVDCLIMACQKAFNKKGLLHL